MEIDQAITRLFDKHRIVFWYDEKKELRKEYESLWLPGVEKIELQNDEYGAKFHILREKPHQKFLIYHEGPQQADLGNWMLDVVLANGVFSADQVSLWMNELRLGPSFGDLVQEHAEFFKNKERLQALKSRLDPDDNSSAVCIKMLAVCVNSGTAATFEAVLETLLAELAEGKHNRMDLIQRCGLESFLQARLEAQFGYKSSSPSIKDFAISLFKACYAQGLEEPSALRQDALVFLKRWRDNVRYGDAFEELSDEYSRILGIEKDLQNRDPKRLVEMDFFSLIDQRILSWLAQQILDRTISAGDCANIIWRRRNTHWFDTFKEIYEALNYASQFVKELEAVDLHMSSLADGIRKYEATWYRLDQNYRKFIGHVRSSRQPTLLVKIADRVENLYSNNFLAPLNENWQRLVDDAKVWEAAPVPNQGEFFDRQIKEYLGTRNKVAVIVSDALRYEIGEELERLIEAEDRFTAEIEPMLGILPSYTKVGMAALLPHQEITVTSDETVQVDGQSTAGKENRTKILAAAVKDGATAIRSEDLLKMSRDESRELARDNQVIYVYHNQIDAVGDKLETEDRVFDATESAVHEIIDIIKKLANANLTNMIVTADHGFIYQNKALDESEYAVKDVEGGQVFARSRRYVIGIGMLPSTSFKTFSANDLGMVGHFQVMIPKSIKRLRLQGSGSRYVHGGASLQEVVVPLIKVNKKRTADLGTVRVDVVSSSSTIITSGQLAVAFFQAEPVSAKMQARQLRAGIYSQDGSPVSDIHTLTFDLAAENPREREVRVRFVLTRKADEVNNQTVYLRLEEQVQDTAHFTEYKTVAFELRRSFTSDFDM